MGSIAAGHVRRAPRPSRRKALQPRCLVLVITARTLTIRVHSAKEIAAQHRSALAATYVRMHVARSLTSRAVFRCASVQRVRIESKIRALAKRALTAAAHVARAQPILEVQIIARLRIVARRRKAIATPTQTARPI